MPLINYSCSCGISFKKYKKNVSDTATSLPCKCGLEAKKVFGRTSSDHKIVIDNGLMARKLEISPDIMEINEERTKRDYSEED